MNALNRASTAFAGLLLACVVLTTPNMAAADSKHHKKKDSHRRAAVCRDDDRRDRDRRHSNWDRRDRDRDRGRDRDRDRDRHRRHSRHAHDVRYVDRSPVFSVGVHIGAYPVVVPVYTTPTVVYVPAHGPYYDAGCDRHFSTFDLVYSHFSDRHAATVRIRG